ncbi:radical SAM domain containing protein [Candidatus Magnetomorum sp. HK-1]|nr:radical SAM domain containing protein [Candidatus Magnetomorum sp. HK-1]
MHNHFRKRLIDLETGTVFKNWHQKISVALVFPNAYPVGMSNLGFQTVYRLLNELNYVVCERFFVDNKTQKAECLSIESGRPLTDFHIIAFSLFVESDFINIVHTLTLADVAVRSNQRQGNDPLVMAGGVITFLNPEPIAPFIDFFFIGEAENLLPQLFDALDPSQNREANLDQIESYEGVYIPERHLRTGIAPKSVTRQFVPSILDFNTCSALISPKATFENTYLIEVSRGCPHGCRYCGAGYVYRPPRFRSLDQLSESIEYGSQVADKIAFMGAAVSDLPFLDKLCEQVYANKMKLAFSSFRADSMSDQWISKAIKTGIKTMTIAPDAGSERLRRVVNKGMNESDILSCVEKLVCSGILHLRIYLMIGLPTENWDDIEETVKFCKTIQSVFVDASRNNHKIGRITISLNCFIPKPSTPFQWAGQEPIPLLKKKIQFLKKNIQKIPNIYLQTDSPRKAYFQTLLSCGNRETAHLIEAAYQLGGNWAQAIKTSKLKPQMTTAAQNIDDVLPWDFLDQGINREFLAHEYQKALDGKTSLPCQLNCRRCGVCR